MYDYNDGERERGELEHCLLWPSNPSTYQETCINYFSNLSVKCRTGQCIFLILFSTYNLTDYLCLIPDKFVSLKEILQLFLPKIVMNTKDKNNSGQDWFQLC
jgi:hypothetical protein